MTADVIHLTPSVRAVIEAVRYRAAAQGCAAQQRHRAIHVAIEELRKQRSGATAVAVAHRLLRRGPCTTETGAA
jgi:hypothetical protein